MREEFKDAEYYSCSEDGTISRTSWADAIGDFLEDDWKEDETIEEQCKRMGPITVAAFNRGEVPAGWIEKRVDSMLEDFRDRFAEEFGCEDYAGDPWPKDDGAYAKSIVTANLTKSIRMAEVYTVEPAGTHTFSVEECIEMLT